jgi:threonine/homoserine/homoserine lactone efflux protein
MVDGLRSSNRRVWWMSFATVTILVAYFPGPALLYTAAQTISHGRRAGLMAMLGIHLGCYVHVFAAAFGLSAVFKHVPELYVAVKSAGALYLIWIGIGMIRSRLAAPDQPLAPPKTVKRALLDSFMVEILNPKVALFFIALLPQFVDPPGSLPVWVSSCTSKRPPRIPSSAINELTDVPNVCAVAARFLPSLFAAVA